jgi:hypothetical protein
MSSTSTDRIYGARSSLAIKAPCAAATTANITLSGTKTIDGYAAVTGDRIVVKNQTSGVDNGIYVVDTAVWSRAPDFDGTADVVTGTMAYVVNGATNGNKFWQITTTGSIVPGTTSISFTAVSIAFGSPSANSITYAMIQQVAANSFLGNPTAASGNLNEIALAVSQLAGRGASGNLAAISIGAGLSIVGTTLTNTISGSLPTQTGNFGKVVTTDGTTASWSQLLRSYISGLTLSTAGASSTMSIAAGIATDSTQASLMQIAAFTKTTSAFATGAGNGGIDTGAIANSTWYHFYLISTAVGVTDITFSTNATTPTLPGTYTLFRRIGSAKTDGSAKWIKFVQDGDDFLWDAAVVDIDATNPGTAVVLRTLTVPTGVKVYAQIYGGHFSGSSAPNHLFTSPDQSDQTQQISGTAALTGMVSFASNPSGSGAQWSLAPHSVRTNTSAQINSKISVSGASDHTGIITRGWTDSRGRNS